MLKIIKKFFTSKKQINHTDNNPVNDQVTIQKSDRFIVSYPKSGSTWMRFMVCSYILDAACDFMKGRDLIPDIHADPDKVRKLVNPRIIKSHCSYNEKYKKIVYLVRDGRDVAVSLYFYNIKFKQILKDTSFSEFLTTFNSEKASLYGSWHNHITSWLDNKKDNILLMRYEDIKRSPSEELSKVITFLGLDDQADNERISRAVTYSSFDKMQQTEIKQRQDIPTHKNSDFSINFIRKGQVGDYKNYFSTSDEQEFIKIQGEALKRLNYI
jgi:hypothetical protein